MGPLLEGCTGGLVLVVSVGWVERNKTHQNFGKTDFYPMHDSEGYDEALVLLHACSTADGFLSSPTKRDNYRRI